MTGRKQARNFAQKGKFFSMKVGLLRWPVATTAQRRL